MSLPVYPGNGTYVDDQLMELLGSYWSTYFGDKTVLRGFQKGRSALNDQTVNDIGEAESLVAVKDCPVYHRELWTPVYFKASEAQSDSVAPLRYGPDRALYNAPGNPPYDKVFNYRSTLAGGYNTVIPVAANIKRVWIITNRINDPTLVLINGVDFTLDLEQNLLILPIDVFTDDRVAKRSTLTADGQPDTEIMLWAYAADVDADYIWSHFGYVFGVRAESKRSYRELVTNVYNVHSGAPSHNGVVRTLSAALDVPVAVGGETVELILTGRTKQIVTDRRVYNVHADSTLLVAVGDMLSAGQALTDTVQILDLSRVSDGLRVREHEGRQWLPDIPADQVVNPDLPGLALDNRFMDGVYFTSIFFPNKEVPVQYVGVTYGYPEVRFEVGGFPGDVEQFWTYVHDRGVSQAEVLANYLDQRHQPIGQPTAKDLPATVNPMLFVLRHLLKYNLMIVKLKRDLGGPEALSTGILNVLRWTLPPHIAYIIFTEIVAGSEEMTDPIGVETAVGHGPAGGAYDMYIHASLEGEPPIVESVGGVLV